MKLEEIRGKDTRELQLDMQSMNKELFELRFKSAVEETSHGARFRELRRTIARVKTVIREREIAAAKDGGND